MCRRRYPPPHLQAAASDSRIQRAGVEIGLWTAAGYITQSLGLLTTDASRASFLSTFTVLVVPFLAGMSGKGVSPVTWASCLAALVGVGLLEQNGAAPGIGDVWSMLSAVAFGVQIFRTEHWARILGNGSNLPLMSVGEQEGWRGGGRALLGQGGRARAHVSLCSFETGNLPLG